MKLKLFLLLAVIYTIISIVKFEVMFSDYENLLREAVQYDTDLLHEMQIAKKHGLLRTAAAMAEYSIGADDINVYWFLNPFNWSKTCFVSNDKILEYLDRWKRGGKFFIHRKLLLV